MDGVPEVFHDFFVASAGVSGALIGLLFVASAVAPERIVQSSAPIRAQETAAGAYLVLIDTLFVALAALIPANTLAVVVPLMAGVGIVGTVIFAGITLVEVRRAGVRWISHRLVSRGFFVWQLVLGIQLAGGDATTGIYVSLVSRPSRQWKFTSAQAACAAASRRGISESVAAVTRAPTTRAL